MTNTALSGFSVTAWLQAASSNLIERATRAIEKQLQHLDEFKKWGETVKCNGEKIADRAERMKKELLLEVEALDQEVSALKAEAV